MLPAKHACLLVFDEFDDVSIGATLAALRTHGALGVVTVGFSGRAVTGASGLRVLPDVRCADVDLARAGLFLLPAGALWLAPERNNPFDTLTACVTEMLQDFDAAGVRVAAAGSAVTALARAGLLEGVSHTADSRDALPRAVPGFEPSPFHVDTPAIHDQNIITATGTAPLALAFEVMTQLSVHESDRAAA